MPKSRRTKKFHKYANVASKALSIALQTKKLLNVEYKHIDLGPVDTTPGNTGITISLNAVSQGDGSGNRDGLSIRMKNVNNRFKVTQNTSATKTIVRISLVMDKMPNSNKAAFTDIYESNSVLAQTNNVTNHRFHVIYDRTIALSSSGDASYVFNWYKQLNHVVKYSGSGGTENDLEKNQLLLCFISSEPTYPPTVSYTSRVRFIDN